MNRDRIRRREIILERFAHARSPEEGLLDDEDYAILIEAFLDTRAGRANEEEIFTLVSWVDDTVICSRILESVIRAEQGIDLDSGGEVLVDAPPPANLLETARDRIPSPYEGAELGVVNARLSFAAARLNAERSWSETELARVAAWAHDSAANRALLDLVLAYPDLGVDITRDGRVAILPAGPAS